MIDSWLLSTINCQSLSRKWYQQFVDIISCWWSLICRWWLRPSTAWSWCHGEAGIRLQSLTASRPPTSTLIVWRARTEVMGRECSSIILCNATCCHLSAAESAVMHVMWVFSDTIEASMIRCDTPSIGCDTILIRIVHSLLCTWLKSGPIKTGTEPEPRFYQKTDRNRPRIWKWKPSQHYQWYQIVNKWMAFQFANKLSLGHSSSVLMNSWTSHLADSKF